MPGLGSRLSLGYLPFIIFIALSMWVMQPVMSFLAIISLAIVISFNAFDFVAAFVILAVSDSILVISAWVHSAFMAAVCAWAGANARTKASEANATEDFNIASPLRFEHPLRGHSNL